MNAERYLRYRARQKRRITRQWLQAGMIAIVGSIYLATMTLVLYLNPVEVC